MCVLHVLFAMPDPRIVARASLLAERMDCSAIVFDLLEKNVITAREFTEVG